MKKIILTLFIILVPTLAHAMFPIISEPVTRRAVAHQGVWAECYVFGGCPEFPSSFGDSETDDGLANEFVLDKAHIVTGVSGYFYDGSLNTDPAFTPNFNIKLYQGTRFSFLGSSNVPDKLVGNWNVQAPHYDGSLRDLNESDLFIVDGLHIPLPAGEYWISAEFGSPGSLLPGFAHGHVVPEPSTMLLLGSGLLGAFVRRRKKF